MAVKTFTDNTTLPASDINTYLNNGGLVYITSQSVGSGVTSASITGCFSATYDAYRVMWLGGTMTSSSGDSQIEFRVGNGGSTWLTTGYYMTLLYVLRTSNTTPRAAGIENGSSGAWIGGGFTDGALVDFQLYDVYKSLKTRWTSQTYLAWGDAGQGAASGFINNQNSYADLRIGVTGAGTMSGGKIYVYGYRTA